MIFVAYCNRNVISSQFSSFVIWDNFLIFVTVFLFLVIFQNQHLWYFLTVVIATLFLASFQHLLSVIFFDFCDHCLISLVIFQSRLWCFFYCCDYCLIFGIFWPFMSFVSIFDYYYITLFLASFQHLWLVIFLYFGAYNLIFLVIFQTLSFVVFFFFVIISSFFAFFWLIVSFVSFFDFCLHNLISYHFLFTVTRNIFTVVTVASWPSFVLSLDFCQIWTFVTVIIFLVIFLTWLDLSNFLAFYFCFLTLFYSFFSVWLLACDIFCHSFDYLDSNFLSFFTIFPSI